MTPLIIGTFLSLFAFATAQFTSPCPKLFKYEPQLQEPDKWYGTVTLLNDAELSGIWLRVIFDKPSLQIGNWFGQVDTTDNVEYLIKNRNHKLPANTPHELRFFVRYNPGETPPRLVRMRLNAKTVCPEEGAVTENPLSSGQLSTSSFLSTTAKPVTNNENNINQIINNIFPNDVDLQFGAPFAPGNQNVPCGTVATKPSPLISYGQNTTQGEWPWHAALYHTQGANLVYTCGGSLISEYHILTAAHCVTKVRTNRPIDVSRLTVYLGKYNLKAFGPGIQDIDISDIFVHPQYNPENLFNDIAVVKLSNSADFTDYIRPVCLWEGDVGLHNVVNKLGTVVGWGFDENRRISDLLMRADMPVAPSLQCIRSKPEFYSQFVSEKSYCAGYRNGTSVCNGDSGGGMVFPKPGTSGGKTIWQIRGLVSVGVALQDELVCDPSHYTVFTDVAKHLDWVRLAMRQ